jgi:hypothetical protein
MRPFVRDILILVGVFTVVTLIAELFGATDLGTAMAFGQIAFMGAIVGLILLRKSG